MKQTSEFFIHRCPECGTVMLADTPRVRCGCRIWKDLNTHVVLPENMDHFPEPIRNGPTVTAVPEFRGRLETELVQIGIPDGRCREEQAVTTLTVKCLMDEPQPFLIDKEIARQLNETIRIQFEALREKQWKERYSKEHPND